MVDFIAAEFQRNRERIYERIYSAARLAGREPDSVKLVVVTKRRGINVVKSVIENGSLILGENYPEEAEEKIRLLKPSYPDTHWHMIGHIQSRKAAIVAKNFDMVHSLDRLKVATRLNSFRESVGSKLPVLLQFNVSGESSKWGWPAWDPNSWTSLLPVIEQINALQNLRVIGVMTMPPLSSNPNESRQYFNKLRNLQDYLQNNIAGINLPECSMGTSADFDIAIQEGATYIRIGEALLGKRN